MAFSLEQSESKERLAEKYAKIIMERVKQSPEEIERGRIQKVIDGFYARHPDAKEPNPVETAL
jgi:hypothetical protein